jgi:pimeloyl-ACP methyl ester carboxylesterase
MTRRAPAAVAFTSVLAAVAGHASDCAALAHHELPHVYIAAAQLVPAQADVPEFCRVQGEARPTADSQIGFELWLPASDWNGRYYQLGNGGFAGSIHLPALAAELRRGNAVAATDTGHHGHAFDATWALNHPEKIIDYGYRSTPVTAAAVHNLVRAYFGTSARYRYFVGCSNGGRQALMTVQRDPQLWDGVIAGAPALRWTEQLAAFARIQHTLRRSGAGWISASKLPAIQRAAVRSCGAEAHVVDGIPDDPRFCPFQAASLLCKGPETDECLTVGQMKSLEIIQHGSPSVADGGKAYFGFEPAMAAFADNWQRWIVSETPERPSQRTLAEEFYRHFVLGEADWSVERFDDARDAQRAAKVMVLGQPLSQVLDAASTDLSPFAGRGGKLLMYFGWADALIAPRSGVDYYERVSHLMGGAASTRRFFRLFMAPGMTHCQGGESPNAFGQAASAPALVNDARHDIRRALEAWVERGMAPDSLVTARYNNNNPQQGLAATRLLCPFPQKNAMRIADKPRSAANEVCAN